MYHHTMALTTRRTIQGAVQYARGMVLRVLLQALHISGRFIFDQIALAVFSAAMHGSEKGYFSRCL